ncbi:MULTISPECIES: HU family DNA-binding protein [unclassified Meiothermus]|uniref:HU family DNA-binding protein n=1 Tax=unclassified Meiothermus TaxID=370471 RepID=UPI000D7BDA63|nr:MULTISPECIES: HU family DNA-binding protein [unclassified Meiothermus]PZA07176.1 integration host factor [Meiothermus sp. Pnk-1]RYM39941.1 HU family DNA-binding protein [Meiothermus sp. PNK-Is4]
MAKKTKTKADLIDMIASSAGMKKKDAKTAVDHFLSHLQDALASGNKVQLTGFGTFEVRKRKARTGVKPGTTQKIKIPASSYPAFKPGKALKEKVKK